MKLYILLFFIPLWASAQGNFEKHRSQKENGFRSEIFTRKEFTKSADTVPASNNFDKNLDGTNQSTNLQTVVIESGGEFKTEKYGFYSQSFWRSLFNSYTYRFSKGEDSHRIGVYIPHPQIDKAIFIKRVLFRAWSKSQSSLATIRVHLYPINREKKIIGPDLLKKAHTLQLDTKRSLKTIEVSEEHIRFPKSGFLLTVDKATPSGKPVVQMKRSKSGNSKSYYIKKEDGSKKTIELTPLGGINRNMQTKLGIEQTDFMLGVSTLVEK